jgi:hypothetical protein
LDGGTLDQHSDGIGELGAVPAPERNTVLGNSQALFMWSGDRIVEPDALYEAAVASVAGIGDNDVIEGALLGACAGKSYDNHRVLSNLARKSPPF